RLRVLPPRALRGRSLCDVADPGAGVRDGARDWTSAHAAGRTLGDRTDARALVPRRLLQRRPGAAALFAGPGGAHSRGGGADERGLRDSQPFITNAAIAIASSSASTMVVSAANVQSRSLTYCAIETTTRATGVNSRTRMPVCSSVPAPSASPAASAHTAPTARQSELIITPPRSTTPI